MCWVDGTCMRIEVTLNSRQHAALHARLIPVKSLACLTKTFKRALEY